MAKIKVHEIAKEFDIKSSDVIAKLAEIGIEGKTASSGLEDDQAEAIRKKLSGSAGAGKNVKEAEKPAKEAAKSPKEEPAKPVKTAETKPAGTAPAGTPVVKKKKPIIVVSSARNAQQGAGRGAAQGAGAQRGGQAARGPQRQGGIIRPTVPTTAERAARMAETNQGGDKDRLRKTGPAPKKENTETDKSVITPVRSDSGSNGGSSGDTGLPKQSKPEQVKRPESAAKSPAKPTSGDRPARGDNKGRGGIVINQGRSFNNSNEPSKDNNARRGPGDRKGNTSKDKNKKDRIFENEDGFKGGK